MLAHANNTGSYAVADTSARRRMAPAARREEILAAATELIAHSGYNGASLDAFASACGMTKAGLLHHFPSKEHLLVGVLERQDQDDALAAAMATTEPVTDAASARAVMTGVLRRGLARPSFQQLYAVLSTEALDPEHPAHEYFQNRARTIRTLYAEELLHWHPSPEQAAVELMSFQDGLRFAWLTDRSIDLLQQWNAFADRFFVDP